MQLDSDTRSYDVLAAVADAGWPDGAVSLPWREQEPDTYRQAVAVLDRHLDGDYDPAAVRRSLHDLTEAGALDRDTASRMAGDHGPALDTPAHNLTTYTVTRDGYRALWNGQD